MNYIQKFILIIFPIVALRFYNYVGIDHKFVTTISLLVVSGALVYSIKDLIFRYIDYRTFHGLIRLFLMNLLLSTLMAFFIWGQNVFLTYSVTIQLWAAVYFFLLYRWQPPVVFVERIFIGYALLFLLMWCVGIYYAPIEVFHTSDYEELNDGRGLFRLRLDGLSYVVMAFFISLNKFVDNEKKWGWLLFAVLLFVGIVLQLTRQVIFLTFLIGILYIVNYKKKWLVYILVSSLILFSFLSSEIFDDGIIGTMTELTENQLDEHQQGNEDIRVTEYRFFFTEFNKSPVGFLFGNGLAHSYSEYGEYLLFLASNYGLFPSDVGYAHIFVCLGLVGLFVFYLLMRKGLKTPLSQGFIYLKLYMFYVLLGNIASSPFMKDIVPFVLCIYLIDRVSLFSNDNESKNEIDSQYCNISDDKVSFDSGFLNK